MRAVVQRVSEARVVVAGETVGEIDGGMLVLVAAQPGDGEPEVQALARKLTSVRLFEDAAGKMNLGAAEVEGAFLVISQFTLGASLRKGRRPSFDGAAKPAEAEPLVDALVQKLREEGFTVETGRFGADMKVSLINDGPATFVIDVREGRVL